MSMLAEPKRKQKFGPDPRNTFWSKDESKFGFRMLESMGWKKGKGLGAKETGMTEHVKAVFRENRDARGVGCSKAMANNWIAHQDDFNSLLSELNSGKQETSANEETVETNASVSIEEKSRGSRSRVHYHKFLKGKDLSSRSDQELDCIFGKRKSQSSADSRTAQTGTDADEDDVEARPCFGLGTGKCHTGSSSSNNLDKDVHSHGVKTIVSTSSVQEYFAKKMAEMKQKRETETVASVSSQGVSAGSTYSDCFSNNSDDAENKMIAEDVDEERKSKKKKKKKKQKTEKEEGEEDTCHVQQTQDQTLVEGVDEQEEELVCENEKVKKSKKKKKKDKKSKDDISYCDTSAGENGADDNTGQQQTKAQEDRTETKKRKRNCAEVAPEPLETVSACAKTSSFCDSQDTSCEPKKKKKKKKSKTSDDEDCQNTSILRHEDDRKTRRRKSVTFSNGEAEVFMIPSKEEDQAQMLEQELMDKKSAKKQKREKAEQQEEQSAPKKRRTEADTEECPMEENVTELKHCTADQKENVKQDKKSRKKKKSKEQKMSKSGDPEVKMSVTVEKESDQSQVAEVSATEPAPVVIAESHQSKGDSVSSGDHSHEKSEALGKKRLSVKIDVDTICRQFVGSNLSSVKGYGN